MEVGFLLRKQRFNRGSKKIKSYLDYGTFTPIQVAAIKALNDCDVQVDEICQMYKSRRNELCDGLNRIGWPIKKTS